jgi:hypothetical protein
MIETIIKLADERGDWQAQVCSAVSAGCGIFSRRGLPAINVINKLTDIEASRSCCRS